MVLQRHPQNRTSRFSSTAHAPVSWPRSCKNRCHDPLAANSKCRDSGRDSACSSSTALTLAGRPLMVIDFVPLIRRHWARLRPDGPGEDGEPTCPIFALAGTVPGGLSAIDKRSGCVSPASRSTVRADRLAPMNCLRQWLAAERLPGSTTITIVISGHFPS